MSFAFTHRKNVEAQVRAMALEQIEKGLEEASQPNDEPNKIVHGLRRRCKKLRGLVRLVGPNFKRADKENKAFCDAASSLSQSRDAVVMVETFAGLLEFDQEGGTRRIGEIEAGRIRQVLEGEAAPAEAWNKDRFAEFRTIFKAARKRTAKWSIDSRGFDAVSDGLIGNYRQFRQRMAAAEDDPVAEQLHEWRKFAKYHGHHLGLLRRSAPDLLKNRQAAIGQLGDLLGDHHNLAVLEQKLAQLDIGGSVLEVIAARQQELAAAAFFMGRQLGAEKPAALRRRLEKYWLLLPEKP
jgi:CHAD domain-containing protein